MTAWFAGSDLSWSTRVGSVHAHLQHDFACALTNTLTMVDSTSDEYTYREMNDDHHHDDHHDDDDDYDDYDEYDEYDEYLCSS